MENQTTDLPAALPAVLPISELAPEIVALAARYRRANGPVIALVNRLGGSLEKQLAAVPEALRSRIEAAAAMALERAHDLAGHARHAPSVGRNGPLAAIMASGAAGGAAGLAGSLAELPVSVMLILHAIRREAGAAGFDPDDPRVRAECLRVFGAGSPMAADDGVNTAFLSARLTLTGAAVQRIIAAVAPRFGVAIGQKLAAQSVPVLGALTGAALNAAYLNWYREVAAIRFQLLRLAQTHGGENVALAFQQATEQAARRPARRS